MQLSKEEYARKRIHNGSSLQIENSVTRVTVRHHSASLVMPNSYPRDRIINQHLTTIKDSYLLARGLLYQNVFLHSLPKCLPWLKPWWQGHTIKRPQNNLIRWTIVFIKAIMLNFWLCNFHHCALFVNILSCLSEPLSCKVFHQLSTNFSCEFIILLQNASRKQ